MRAFSPIDGLTADYGLQLTFVFRFPSFASLVPEAVALGSATVVKFVILAGYVEGAWVEDW